jgi:hypothetical protein
MTFEADIWLGCLDTLDGVAIGVSDIGFPETFQVETIGAVLTVTLEIKKALTLLAGVGVHGAFGAHV